MGRAIDFSNYRAACAPLIMEFRRFSDSPLRAGMAEGVANLLWQFGDPEADEWFRRALEVYRLVLVGDYERAVMALNEADDACLEHRPYVLPALRAVTRFGLTGDTTSLSQAVQHLRTQVDEWPTDGIALHHDVMRVAERLGGVVPS